MLIFISLPVLAGQYAKKYKEEYLMCGVHSHIMAIYECEFNLFERIENHIDKSYENWSKHLDATTKGKLNSAQKNWIQYRQSDCLIYNNFKKVKESNYTEMIGYYSCMIEHNINRLEKIEHYRKILLIN